MPQQIPHGQTNGDGGVGGKALAQRTVMIASEYDVNVPCEASLSSWCLAQAFTTQSRPVTRGSSARYAASSRELNTHNPWSEDRSHSRSGQWRLSPRSRYCSTGTWVHELDR